MVIVERGRDRGRFFAANASQLREHTCSGSVSSPACLPSSDSSLRRRTDTGRQWEEAWHQIINIQDLTDHRVIHRFQMSGSLMPVFHNIKLSKFCETPSHGFQQVGQQPCCFGKSISYIITGLPRYLVDRQTSDLGDDLSMPGEPAFSEVLIILSLACTRSIPPIRRAS